METIENHNLQQIELSPYPFLIYKETNDHDQPIEQKTIVHINIDNHEPIQTIFNRKTSTGEHISYGMTKKEKNQIEQQLLKGETIWKIVAPRYYKYNQNPTKDSTTNLSIYIQQNQLRDQLSDFFGEKNIYEYIDYTVFIDYMYYTIRLNLTNILKTLYSLTEINTDDLYNVTISNPDNTKRIKWNSESMHNIISVFQILEQCITTSNEKQSSEDEVQKTIDTVDNYESEKTMDTISTHEENTEVQQIIERYEDESSEDDANTYSIDAQDENYILSSDNISIENTKTKQLLEGNKNSVNLIDKKLDDNKLNIEDKLKIAPDLHLVFRSNTENIGISNRVEQDLANQYPESMIIYYGKDDNDKIAYLKCKGELDPNDGKVYMSFSGELQNISKE